MVGLNSKIWLVLILSINFHYFLLSAGRGEGCRACVNIENENHTPSRLTLHKRYSLPCKSLPAVLLQAYHNDRL